MTPAITPDTETVLRAGVAAMLDHIAAHRGDTAGLLPDVLAQVARYDLHQTRAVLRHLCDRGYGTWLDPDTRSARPATHMVEIDAFGATATGADPLDATANWLTVARRIAGAEPPEETE